MFSFNQLFETSTAHHIDKTEDGSHYYSSKHGDNTIITHFLPKQTKDGGKHYDVHFSRHNGNKTDPTSRQGVNRMSSEDRIRSIHSVSKAVHHFIKNNRPDSLTATANTKGKSDWTHGVLSKMAARGGHKIKTSGNDTSIHFKSSSPDANTDMSGDATVG